MRHRELRCPSDLPVSVEIPDGRTLICVVVNVSQKGARLKKLDHVNAGDLVKIRLEPGRQPREAEVRWRKEPHCGIKFAEPLDEHGVATVRKAVAHHKLLNPRGWNLELREMR